jgi:nucleotide-binding universal stress UspA family protein
MKQATFDTNLCQITNPHLETTRLRFRNVLVGIDFSSSAQAALRVAVGFAKRFDSRLILVHAVLPVMTSMEGPLDPAFLNANIDDAKQQMNELAKHLGVEAIRHEKIVYSTSAIDGIQSVATLLNVDLIIMGSHGPGGVEKVVLGSVAEAVLRGSHVPVMVVGPNCKKVHETTGFNSILLATDLGIGSLRPAQYAAAIAEEVNAKLTLVHVGSEARDVSELARKQVYERIKNLIPADASLWCEPDVRIEVGNASAQILNTALAEHADLIVAGTREAGPLSDHAPWSTVSKLIRGAPCPVLAIRAHAA